MVLLFNPADFSVSSLNIQPGQPQKLGEGCNLQAAFLDYDSSVRWLQELSQLSHETLMRQRLET